MAQAEAFWQAFRAQELWLAELAVEDFVREAGSLLAQHAAGLSVELDSQPSVYAPDKRALRITAHGNSARFPEVLLLVRQATGLSLHSVQAFRSRVPARRFALQNQDLRLSTHEVWLCHHAHEGLVGLEVALPELPAEQQVLAQRMVLEMLMHVLGEWDLAIRVGPITFVDSLPRQRMPCPLHEYAGAFDDFSAISLGYSNDFPVEDDGPWRAQPLRDAYDQPQALWLINLGAKAVAMQPEWAYAVWMSMPVWDDESLQHAHDIQHAVAMALQRERAGVQAMVLVENGECRTSLYQVGEPQDALHALASLGEVAQGLQVDWQVTWSPRWQHYLEALQLESSLSQAPDSFFQGLGLL